MGPALCGPIIPGFFMGDMKDALLGDMSMERWKAPGLGALGRWLAMDEELE